MNDKKQNKKVPPNPPFLKGAGGIQNRYLPYNKNLKHLSRNLRNESTLAEIVLWKELRAAGVGYTFNRQKPILNYIVDFYCKPLNLVIEVGGITHWDEEQVKQDKIRQAELEKLGLHFLRFDDSDVLKDLENVIQSIEFTIEELENLYPDARKRKKLGNDVK
jgi:very-short-patch-repair endonuclease